MLIKDGHFFSLHSTKIGKNNQSLTELSNRWEDYLKKQTWIIESISIGHHRKNAYDCKQPTITSTKEAIGPLTNEIGVSPFLALWTSKANVIVGLHDGLEEHLNNTDKNWIYSGIYAVIQFNEGTKQVISINYIYSIVTCTILT
ncbi:11812_t:CDS:2 [Entrophospora sp. SA101]|nr:11812_t:CDS:2 [Entrophospora sp. SA101]CAJ0824373.1 6280_t:CDS:2 [Entrophospora sp. SA101]